MRLPSFNECFCCGKQNPAGIQAEFYVDNNQVMSKITPDKKFCGYPGILHGGLTATILDEAMTWAAAVYAKKFHYAGEVKVRYKAPVYQDKEITIKAHVVNKMRQILVVEGFILDEDGNILAKSEGKYYPLSDIEDQKVRKSMNVYEDGFKL